PAPSWGRPRPAPTPARGDSARSTQPPAEPRGRGISAAKYRLTSKGCDGRCMSISGTDAYAGLTGLPDLVVEAVDLARRLGFPSSCRPEQGRLLHALAAGALKGIGETGTGCGVGLAWMIAARRPGVSIVSVERD